jgi:hypothetical protein
MGLAQVFLQTITRQPKPKQTTWEKNTIERDNATILQADIQCAISQPLAQVSITKNNTKNHCELANKKKPQ